MNDFNRRDFIKTSAVTAGAASLTSMTAACSKAQAVASHGTYSVPKRFDEDLADYKPRVALIGCGWYGKNDLSRMMQVAPVEVVSLCDVDSKLLAEAADITAQRQYSKNKPKTFTDYRKLLAEGDVDIAIVGTPDHWHALNAIAAMEAGCDLYCQKPISVDIAEGQAMMAAAKKHDRVVQVGLQRRSTKHLIDAKERFVNEDMLGKIAHVETFGYFHMRAKVPPKKYPVPENLDWDFYCGPAPETQYHPIMHLRGWRSWRAFGNGATGDIGIHMIDTARWMLGLGSPRKVSAHGGILMGGNSMADVPDTQSAIFDFGNTTMTWQLRTWGDPPESEYPWGCAIYGDKGTLKFDLWKAEYTPRNRKKKAERIDCWQEQDLYPEERSEKWLEPQATPATRVHHADFLRCVRDRKQTVAPLEEGHISSTCCILANNAMDLGRTIEWDGEQCVGDDEANAMLKRAYRAPWTHPADV